MQSKCCDQHHVWLHGETNEKLSFYCYSLQWITTTIFWYFSRFLLDYLIRVPEFPRIVLVFSNFSFYVQLFCIPDKFGHAVFYSLKNSSCSLLGFSGFLEKLVTSLYPFQDFGIEPFWLDFTLHSLLLQREMLINNTIENFIPGVNYIIWILKYKGAVPEGFIQGWNKLLFIKTLDVLISYCGVMISLFFERLNFLLTITGRWSVISEDIILILWRYYGWLPQMWSRPDFHRLCISSGRALYYPVPFAMLFFFRYYKKSSAQWITCLAKAYYKKQSFLPPSLSCL